MREQLCKRKLSGGSETDPESVVGHESDHSSGAEPLSKMARSHAATGRPCDEKLAPSAAVCNAKQEALFSAGMLLDLAGSTSAEVRRMTDDERALVHFKRRLRNRESAKRSRARRQATINDIQAELHDLRDLTASLLDRCVRLARQSDKQVCDIETLSKEKAFLETLLRGNSRGSSP